MDPKAEGMKDGRRETKDLSWGVGTIQIVGPNQGLSEMYPLYSMVNNPAQQQAKLDSSLEPTTKGQIDHPDTKSGSLTTLRQTKISKSKVEMKSNPSDAKKSSKTKRDLKRHSIPVKRVTPPDDLDLSSDKVPSSPTYSTRSSWRLEGSKAIIIPDPLPKPVDDSLKTETYAPKGTLYENLCTQGDVKPLKNKEVAGYHNSNTLEAKKVKQSYPCQECDKTFKTISKYKRHMLTHTHLRPFQCEFCGKGFKTTGDLYGHRKIHGKKSHKCTFCDLSFATCLNRDGHERTHTGEKPYVCEFCDRKFALRCTMVRHLRVHTRESPYVCQFCGQTFRQHTGLKNHIKNYHFHLLPTAEIHVKKTELNVIYRCTMCGEDLDNPYVLEMHRRKHFADRDTVNQMKTGLSEENPVMFRVVEEEPAVLEAESPETSGLPLCTTESDCESYQNYPSYVVPATCKESFSTRTTKGIVNSGPDYPVHLQQAEDTETSRSSLSTTSGEYSKETRTSSADGTILPISQVYMERPASSSAPSKELTSQDEVPSTLAGANVRQWGRAYCETLTSCYPLQDRESSVQDARTSADANPSSYTSLRDSNLSSVYAHTVYDTQDTYTVERFTSEQDSRSVQEISATDFGTFVETYQKINIDNPCPVFCVKNDNCISKDDPSASATTSVGYEHLPIVYDTDVMQQSFSHADYESNQSLLYSRESPAYTSGSFPNQAGYMYDATPMPLNYPSRNVYHPCDSTNYLFQDATNALAYDAQYLNNSQGYLQHSLYENDHYVYFPNTYDPYSNPAASVYSDSVYVAEQPYNIASVESSVL